MNKKECPNHSDLVSVTEYTDFWCDECVDYPCFLASKHFEHIAEASDYWFEREQTLSE